jgi:Helix-turn-helix domain of transposase family ISL3
VGLWWRQRRYRCLEPACPIGGFSEDHPLAAARAKLTTRAAWWAISCIQRDTASVAAVARRLGVDWHTVWDAIKPLLAELADDPDRLADIDTLGVDEHIWHHRPRPGKGPKELTGIVDLTRAIERHGNTHGAAERALAVAIRDRVRAGGSDSITGDTRIAALAKAWLTQIEEQHKSPTTAFAYRYAADRHVIPGLGNLRVREFDQDVNATKVLYGEVDHSAGILQAADIRLNTDCRSASCRNQGLDAAQRSRPRPVNTTCAPASVNLFTTASPMPRLPPVTMAVLPLSERRSPKGSGSGMASEN